jgi:hypothetical protein
MSKLIACLIVIAACWRGGSQTEPEVEEPVRPRVKGATCTEVARNARDVVERAADKQLAARATPLGELVQRRCEADAWSMELRRCVTAAKTVEEATECDELATDEQRNAFAADLEATIVTEDGP